MFKTDDYWWVRLLCWLVGEWINLLLTGGVRNISNQLTIGTKIDAMSANLKEFATEKGKVYGKSFIFLEGILNLTKLRYSLCNLYSYMY